MSITRKALPTSGFGDVVDHAAVSQLMARLTANRDDAALTVLGDSTGAAPGYWVDLLKAWLAAQFPTHTVRYHLWADDGVGGGSYAAPVTVQTGTGAYALSIYNGSAPGRSFDYLLQNFDALLAVEPHLIMFNVGHNDGPSDVSYESFRDSQVRLCAVARARWPQASVLTMSQNPRFDAGSVAGIAERRALMTRRAAAAVGVGFIDINEIFLKTGNPQAYLDSSGGAAGLHPTTSGPNNGSQLWADAIIRMFQVARANDFPLLPQPSSPLLTPGVNLLTATSDFKAFAGTSAPSGWAGTVTHSADTTNVEAGAAAWRITGTGSGQPAAYSDSLPLPLLRANGGEWVTAAARVFIPAAVVSGTAGLIGLDDGVVLRASRGSGYHRGKWTWLTVTKRFSPSATYARVLLYANSAAGTDTMAIDRVCVVRGVLPRDMR